jgi:hypothetical protein
LKGSRVKQDGEVEETDPKEKGSREERIIGYVD